MVALGAYGRRELTPRTEAELVFLHPEQTDLAMSSVTEAVCYPLWERGVRIEPTVRTPAECAALARRSWSAAATFLDARLVSGHAALFDDFVRQVTQPWRRDQERLRHRARAETQRRHATHASAATSLAPDLVAGRGGLLDVQALRWLEAPYDERLGAALDFLLRSLSAAEDLAGQTPHRLSARLQERLAGVLGLDDGFLDELYRHTRWVAFNLDSVLAPDRDDRPLGPGLALRRGELIAERPPPLRRAPSLGLRVANLVGLAPPDSALLAWACEPGPPILWDAATLDQFWRLLRAADWRAWDFLDVSHLLLRYVPELRGIWRQRSPSAVGDLALDAHSFQSLRRLHEWTESGDPLAGHAWRPLRQHDLLYLAVLLHELDPSAAAEVAQRLGLAEDAADNLSFVVGNHGLLGETATRRDLHDEDLLLELATRIGTPQRLSLLLMVAAAHDMACVPSAWTPWKADLMRELFGRLESVLRQSGEFSIRRTRSVDQHRERIVAELQRRKMDALVPLVGRLPRRYVLTRTPAFVARHLGLLDDRPLADGEVRLRAHLRRQTGLWDVLIVARDRPGLLATMAGVLALRGASVLAADAATCADGLVLDVFTVSGGSGIALDAGLWPGVAADVQAALDGRVPLHDLLGARRLQPHQAEAIHVSIDNAASQFFSLVEVRAPDQVGLLFRIADALHEVGLDIHHARIATYPEGALDVFYVWDLSGEKLGEAAAAEAATAVTARLRGHASETA